MSCTASSSDPIIFFLDDVQWADTGSLEVTQAILSDRDSKHIIFLMAYRDEEMPEKVLEKYFLPHKTCKKSRSSSNSCGLDDDKTGISAGESSELGLHCARVTFWNDTLWNPPKPACIDVREDLFFMLMSWRKGPSVAFTKSTATSWCTHESP